MTLSNVRVRFGEELLRDMPEVLSRLPASAQTEALCVTAVRQNRRALKYIRQQTPAICQAAVEHDANALEYITEQPPTLCLDAVRRDGLALCHVRRQTPDICLAAIQQHPDALDAVKDQTVALCVAALEQRGTSLEFVRLPHDCLLDPESVQLDDWRTVLRACASTDSASIACTLLPLIAAIPLGKQYCDEWCQATPDGGLFIEQLLDLAGEAARLAPGIPDVNAFVHRAHQQQEWILCRQWITSAKEGRAPTGPAEQEFTL